MTYYATSPSARRSSSPGVVVVPTAPTTVRKVVQAVGTLLLGLVTSAFTCVAMLVIFLFAGTYNGQEVTPADVTAAHHGQIALVVLALVAGAPWLATAAQRRRGWQLEGVIGVAVMALPLWLLVTHLDVTSWRQLFTF